MENIKLSKQDLIHLRNYGYMISIKAEEGNKRCLEIINYIYKYHRGYYFLHCNKFIKERAEAILEQDSKDKEWYKSFRRNFRKIKIQLIKEYYGIIIKWRVKILLFFMLIYKT